MLLSFWTTQRTYAVDVPQQPAKIDNALVGELLGGLVVLAHLVGQPALGYASTKHSATPLSRCRKRIMSLAPSAQLSPTANGRMWQIEL